VAGRGQTVSDEVSVRLLRPIAGRICQGLNAEYEVILAGGSTCGSVMVVIVHDDGF